MASYKSFRQSILATAAKTRTPVLGEFELTARCNLNCTMCFVRENKKNEELSTEAWKALFDEAVDAGLLFATLTGGEIFMREDFAELYDYLYTKGVRITLFTNGTAITEEIADMLQKRPPEYISITLYGADNETYETVTRIQHGFDKVQRGIRLLKERKLNIALRTIPIQATYEKLDDIFAFAKGENLPMNYFLYVGPRRDGGRETLNDRLSPEALDDFEKRFKETFSNASDETFEHTEDKKTCVALKCAYFVNFKGYMQPCAMVDRPKEKIEGNLQSAFRRMADTFENIAECDLCQTCELANACIQCYARRRLEEGENACAKYLKAFAEYRRDAK